MTLRRYPTDDGLCMYHNHMLLGCPVSSVQCPLCLTMTAQFIRPSQITRTESHKVMLMKETVLIWYEEMLHVTNDDK